jgi:hypothetical protein
MRNIAILAVLLLSGCNAYVSDYGVHQAQVACEQHGGLAGVKPANWIGTGVQNNYYAVCLDQTLIYWEYKGDQK